MMKEEINKIMRRIPERGKVAWKNILYAEGKIFLVCEMKEKESIKGAWAEGQRNGGKRKLKEIERKQRKFG